MANDFLDMHPFVRILAADKARGVILGGALGDACGLYTEFLSSAEAKQSYNGGIEFGRSPLRGDPHRDKFSGSWTDDTDHALLLVLSFLHHYGGQRQRPSASILAQDFAKRLQCWCEQGLLALSTPPLGLGRTIGSIAIQPAFLENPKALASDIWVKAGGNEKPASNGSLMRAHPLGVIASAYETDTEAFKLASELSKTTHGDPRCTLASCAFVAILRGIIRGEVTCEDDLDYSLVQAEAFMKANPELCELDHEVDDEDHRYQWLKLDEFKSYTDREATYTSLQLDEAPKIGYVYKCLGAGILTLRLAMRADPTSETFETRMLALIMEGGDADTNGSVAGALLGAWLGESRLPQAWIRKLNHHEWLQEKAVRFAAAAGIQDRAGAEAWERIPRDIDADIHGGRVPLTREELGEREGALVTAVIAKLQARREAELRPPKIPKRRGIIKSLLNST